jgi:hypothetical protein
MFICQRFILKEIVSIDPSNTFEDFVNQLEVTLRVRDKVHLVRIRPGDIREQIYLFL